MTPAIDQVWRRKSDGALVHVTYVHERDPEIKGDEAYVIIRRSGRAGEWSIRIHYLNRYYELVEANDEPGA